MAQPRIGCRLWLALAVVGSLGVAVAESGPAHAQVSSVTGSALGVFADNISIFGGAQPDSGPTPTVTLPAAGSAAPVTATVATSLIQYGPATLFSSGPLTVTTQGTTGAAGSVTTSSAITNVNTSGQEVFTAASVSSTCTAAEAGTTASTTITGGTVITSEGNPAVAGDEVVVPVPASPAPNTVINGAIEGVGDTFKYVFNEQVTGTDGTITVTAAHMYLLGPTALGDVFIGRSVCGVNTSATVTTSTTVAPASTTTTTTRAASTTTTTAAGGGVAGGAFGYRSSVSLFGGAAAAKGPTPTVTLPASGSATPITASDPSASVQYGPAIIFESGKLDVSTQGTTSPRSVTSSATVLNPGPPPFSANKAASTCTADATGAKGSATIENGKVVTKTDADSNPVTTANVPVNPPPNTEIKGTLDVVGDSFRWVFNEQIVGSDGSITVNAAHEYLLGPVAVGELIIGQSRCATTATAFVGPAGQGSGTPTATTAADIARTGSTTASLGALGMVLVTWGLLALVVGGQLLLTAPGHHLGLPTRKRRRQHRS